MCGVCLHKSVAERVHIYNIYMHNSQCQRTPDERISAQTNVNGNRYRMNKCRYGMCEHALFVQMDWHTVSLFLSLFVRLFVLSTIGIAAVVYVYRCF